MVKQNIINSIMIFINSLTIGMTIYASLNLGNFGDSVLNAVNKPIFSLAICSFEFIPILSLSFCMDENDCDPTTYTESGAECGTNCHCCIICCNKNRENCKYCKECRNSGGLGIGGGGGEGNILVFILLVIGIVVLFFAGFFFFTHCLGKSASRLFSFICLIFFNITIAFLGSLYGNAYGMNMYRYLIVVFGIVCAISNLIGAILVIRHLCHLCDGGYVTNELEQTNDNKNSNSMHQNLTKGGNYQLSDVNYSINAGYKTYNNNYRK